MANNFRYRWGEANPIEVPVDSTTVIEIGDLLYLDTDDAKPASSQTDQSSAEANQELFSLKFLGVAASASANGDTDPVRVNTTGVHEFPCASANFVVGDMIGVTETGAGTALEDQKVVGVDDSDNGIGICVKSGTAVTTVLVDIRSTILGHGVKKGVSVSEEDASSSSS